MEHGAGQGGGWDIYATYCSRQGEWKLSSGGVEALI